MQASIQFVKKINVNLPLIQAPMAGAATPSLVAVVSNAGGLGSFAAGYLQADAIHRAIDEIQTLTHRPFAVNLFIPQPYSINTAALSHAKNIVESCCRELNFEIKIPQEPYAPYFEDQLQVILDREVPVFSFTFGVLSTKWIDLFKEKNITLIGTATTTAEALMLAQANIDMVVLQGSEAGGHRGSFLSDPLQSLSDCKMLLAKARTEINIPLIAAGGIMTGQQGVDYIKDGAAAVQMGTAFLTCHESSIHPRYKRKLLNLNGDETVLTRAFSGKTARGIANTFTYRMKAYEQAILPYPVQHALTVGMRNEAMRQNNIDFLAMWAGTNAALCQNLSAKEIVENFANAYSEVAT